MKNFSEKTVLITGGTQGLVHRMDRPVGGLVALARTGKAAARLSQQLRNHQMQREYLTVVHGCGLPHSGTLRNMLAKDESTGNVRMVNCEEKSAPSSVPPKERMQEAILHYTVLAKNNAADTMLMHIRLQTGRKHQIRVQLAHSGHPIVQDMRYGQDLPGDPIALWGSVLRLTHPTRSELMTFLSPPQGKAFVPFSEEIRAFWAMLSASAEPSPT